MKHSSSVSAVYSFAAAARAAELPVSTVNLWVARGVVALSGKLDGKPAFTEADIAELRKLRAKRNEVRKCWEFLPR